MQNTPRKPEVKVKPLFRSRLILKGNTKFDETMLANIFSTRRARDPRVSTIGGALQLVRYVRRSYPISYARLLVISYCALRGGSHNHHAFRLCISALLSQHQNTTKEQPKPTTPQVKQYSVCAVYPMPQLCVSHASCVCVTANVSLCVYVYLVRCPTLSGLQVCPPP